MIDCEAVKFENVDAVKFEDITDLKSKQTGKDKGEFYQVVKTADGKHESRSVFLSPWLHCFAPLRVIEPFTEVLRVSFLAEECGLDALAFQKMFYCDLAPPAAASLAAAANPFRDLLALYPDKEIVSFVRKTKFDDKTWIVMKINANSERCETLHFERGELYRVAFRLSWQVSPIRNCVYLIATLV